MIADAVPVIIADGKAPNKPEFDAITGVEKHSALRLLGTSIPIPGRQEAVQYMLVTSRHS